MNWLNYNRQCIYGTGDGFVNVGPGTRAAKVTLDAALRPLGHLLLQIHLSATRLQTERVTAQVDGLFRLVADPVKNRMNAIIAEQAVRVWLYR